MKIAILHVMASVTLAASIVAILDVAAAREFFAEMNAALRRYQKI